MSRIWSSSIARHSSPSFGDNSGNLTVGGLLGDAEDAGVAAVRAFFAMVVQDKVMVAQVTVKQPCLSRRSAKVG